MSRPLLPRQGVCDPAAVTTWALSNSASISGSLLTTEALVIERKMLESEHLNIEE